MLAKARLIAQKENAQERHENKDSAESDQRRDQAGFAEAADQLRFGKQQSQE